MKKQIVCRISLLLIIVLAAACLWWYPHRKTSDTVPPLSALSQLDEEEITGLLAGYHREQLHAVWGEPEGGLFGMFGEIWPLDGENGRYLYVYFTPKAVADYARLRTAE